MSGTHPLAAKAQEVIRLVGHVPEKFCVSAEVAEQAGGMLGLVVTHKETGMRRIYEVNGPGDWGFELETDLKGGYFGPS